jgi:hypothetical protein
LISKALSELSWPEALDSVPVKLLFKLARHDNESVAKQAAQVLGSDRRRREEILPEAVIALRNEGFDSSSSYRLLGLISMCLSQGRPSSSAENARRRLTDIDLDFFVKGLNVPDRNTRPACAPYRSVVGRAGRIAFAMRSRVSPPKPRQSASRLFQDSERRSLSRR